MKGPYRGLVAILLSATLVYGCGVVKPRPIKEETIIHQIDSIAWHDSTIMHYLDKERYVDIVKPLDTLHLETSYAKATAYLDTANTVLRGEIENKDVPIKQTIKWKEKIVYRDATIIKEVPVEVTKEVIKYPKTYWWFMAISILAVVYLGVKLYLKFKLK